MSELTARRDVSELVEKRLVNNVHGTIFYNMEQSGNDSYLLSIAGSKHQSEKRRIGEYAAKIIQPGEFVIIDNGSTTEQLAASIPVNAEATVLCYNVNVLNNLYQKPNINLLFCGGTFHHLNPIMIYFPVSMSFSLQGSGICNVFSVFRI